MLIAFAAKKPFLSQTYLRFFSCIFNIENFRRINGCLPAGILFVAVFNQLVKIENVFVININPDPLI